MLLDSLVTLAKQAGASDLHLEPGLPPAMRINGTLKIAGDPISGTDILNETKSLVDNELWTRFIENKSLDLSKMISGVRSRINIFQTSRGIGLSIRLLVSFQATIESLNLHPTLMELTSLTSGLVLVCGSTGSGKSSTIAALIQEINTRSSKHIITIESPIEYSLRSKYSLIRQREVGRDTPSFEQALIDSLREDPDVIVVGEMREKETMKLTLGAAETGHLVFSTLHSSNTSEALHRLISAFPAEEQNSVAAQLAECLEAVICQRLRYWPELGIRIPECEILRINTGAKSYIRQIQLGKLDLAIETGGDDGSFTFYRYQKWLKTRSRFNLPSQFQSLPPDETPVRNIPKPIPAKIGESKKKSNLDGIIDLDEGGDLMSALKDLF